MLASSKIYLYTFDYKGQYTHFDEEDKTVFPFSGDVTHADDDIYIFPFHPSELTLNENDRAMEEIMVELWTTFATNGVPSVTTARNVFECKPMTSKRSSPEAVPRITAMRVNVSR